MECKRLFYKGMRTHYQQLDSASTGYLRFVPPFVPGVVRRDNQDRKLDLFEFVDERLETRLAQLEDVVRPQPDLAVALLHRSG